MAKCEGRELRWCLGCRMDLACEQVEVLRLQREQEGVLQGDLPPGTTPAHTSKQVSTSYPRPWFSREGAWLWLSLMKLTSNTPGCWVDKLRQAHFVTVSQGCPHRLGSIRYSAAMSTLDVPFDVHVVETVAFVDSARDFFF